MGAAAASPSGRTTAARAPATRPAVNFVNDTGPSCSTSAPVHTTQVACIRFGRPGSGGTHPSCCVLEARAAPGAPRCHTLRPYFFSVPKEHQCTPNCYAFSPQPDTRISSTSVEPEGSQASDTMHRGSLVLGGAWAHCSSGRVHASPVTNGPRWNWRTNSPVPGPGSESTGREVGLTRRSWCRLVALR